MTKENKNEKSVRGTRLTAMKREAKGRYVKWGKVVIILALAAILGVLLYGVKLLNDTDNFLNEAYQPVKRETSINDNIDPIKDPIAILILGIDNNDERNLESTRTDAMLLATVSPVTKEINLVSIPRDTYTKIKSPEFLGMDKINAAYAYGEIESTMDAVENLMNVPINYYITVDFKAFEDIVDAFDGVEVDVPFNFVEQNAKSEFTVKLKKGKHTLNGEQALAFARTRKIDNDVMRGSRQQEIMQAVLKKAMSAGSITKFEEVMRALSGHFWTDMDMGTMLKIVQSGLATDYDFESYIFSWMSFDYYGVSMVGLHDDSLEYISHKMRVSLGLDKPDKRDKKGYKLKTDGEVSPRTFPNDGMAVIN